MSLILTTLQVVDTMLEMVSIQRNVELKSWVFCVSIK